MDIEPPLPNSGDSPMSIFRTPCPIQGPLKHFHHGSQFNDHNTNEVTIKGHYDRSLSRCLVLERTDTGIQSWLTIQ